MSSSRSARSTAAGGAVACSILAAVALADQLWFGWTRHDVANHYGPHGLHPDPNVLTVVSVVLFLIGAAGFGLVAHSLRRGHRRMGWGLVCVGAITGITVACVTTFAAEYDGHVLTIGWRLAPWLIPILCCCVASQLLTSRRSQPQFTER